MQFCTLELEYFSAHRSIAHTYLFRMLTCYGSGMKFITLIQVMYDKAFPSVQIKGYVVGPFPIQCSMRQGCPMSMLLFALVLKPLISHARYLTGCWIVQRTTKIAVVAYANDFTTFVTAPAEIQTIGDLPLTYIRATAARLNIRKSKAMAAGSKDTSMNMLNIPYYQERTVMECRVTSTVAVQGLSLGRGRHERLEPWQETRTVGTFV